ncbi:histidine kinase [Streptococcus cristatus]|uniref:histidine kinase n=2 Tax=Streptococcus cristatus TaxID=45634 RepID=A0A512ABJ7_STRCR|nr:sensor histidine kinase [Streptococcus cristatus]AGK71721.1 histidine kinase [Streptococcus cristatus AS 1.3089]GEN97091.1 histidine kinase [Streptococcus cristatus]SQI48610.1 histidine kinase [Streptococcus cristatus]
MDMQDKFFFLRHHLYSRRFILSLLLVIFSVMGMFAFIFEDGRSLLEYQLLLAFLLASFFLGMDLASAYKDYRNQLFYASGRPQTALEALLFEKLALLEMDKKNRAIEEREKLNDLMDYYTLWAHQIKTPIAASSLLVGEIEDKKVKNQLEQELFKIESYVNIVLQYLRLESFHEDLVLKKENVEDLVKEIVKKYAIFFIQKDLSLSLHDLDRTIITDKKWFVVILEQVLSNSLKYTSQGGIEIYFQEDTLYIKDSGLGIQDADLLRVFERGFSGYNGRLTQQSSGLGLYLSKKIADELGHQISIASQVGKGTTVMISFSEKKMIFE